ncbi:MAG: CBS domain-containing protein [Stappiaceae bacterium]
MIVANILDEKGRDIITVLEEASLNTICATLTANKIGAVIVVHGDGSIAGILSERDIVRALCSSGPSSLESTAKEHMTGKVVTCNEKETTDEVMAKMTAGRFRHLPVVTDGKLVGLISIGDVVKQKIAMVEQEAEQIKSYITMS